MFPVTVGGVTYNLADFYPLGYVTALPNSVASMYDALFVGMTGTSTSSYTLGGSGSITTQTGLGFKQFDRLTIAETTNPSARYVEIGVNTYNPSTGLLTWSTIYRTVGSGTFTSWSIAPMLGGPNQVPFPIAYGGLGDGQGVTIRAEAGVAFPDLCMQRIFEDFDTRIASNEFQYPWKVRTITAGTGLSSVSMIPMITTDSNAQNNAGILVLDSTGHATPALRTTNYGKTFLGYGDVGFIDVSAKGGPVEYQTAVRLSHLIDSSNVVTTRFGLRGNGSSWEYLFDYYGIGFEIASNNEGGQLTCVVAQEGKLTRFNSGTTISTTGYHRCGFIVDPFEGVVKFYVSGALVYTHDISDWPNKVASLLHPAFVHRTETGTARQAYFDYLYCTQRILRRMW